MTRDTTISAKACRGTIRLGYVELLCVGLFMGAYPVLQLGQDAHRDKSPRPFDFRQPAETEEVQNFLHGPPLGNTDKGAGKKV